MVEHQIPLEQLRERLEAEPCLGAIQLLAETYYQLRQYPQAAEASRRGLTLYPDSLELQLVLGQTLAALNQWDEAEAILQPVLAKIRTLSELFRTLQHLYERQERRPQASRMKTIYRLLLGERPGGKVGAARILPTLEKWQRVLTTSISIRQG